MSTNAYVILQNINAKKYIYYFLKALRTEICQALSNFLYSYVFCPDTTDICIMKRIDKEF